jgi:hypothetical protein
MELFTVFCGEFDVLASGVLMSVPDKPIIIKSDFLTITIQFEDDDTGDIGYSSFISSQEANFILTNVLSRRTISTSEPQFLGKITLLSGEVRRLFFNFSATRADGCISRTFTYTLYSSPDIRYSWDLSFQTGNQSRLSRIVDTHGI